MQFRAFFFILSCVLCSASAWAEDAPKEAAAKDAAAKDAKEGEAPAPDAPLEPGADYICEVDIFYNWKPAPPKPKKMDKPLAGGKSTASQPTPTPQEETSDKPDNIREFFTTAGEQGLVKDEIINRLNSKIPFYERQASEACKNSHQDQTLCVSSRLRASFEQYNKLDYATRKAMTDGIRSDCEDKLGKCFNTEASEVRCQINRSPEVLPKPPEATGEAAAKDKKKK